MRKILFKPFRAVWRWIQCLVSRENTQESPKWINIRNGGKLPQDGEKVKVYLRSSWSGVYLSDYYQIGGLWHSPQGEPVVQPKEQVLEWKTNR